MPRARPDRRRPARRHHPGRAAQAGPPPARPADHDPRVAPGDLHGQDPPKAPRGREVRGHRRDPRARRLEARGPALGRARAGPDVRGRVPADRPLGHGRQPRRGRAVPLRPAPVPRGPGAGREGARPERRLRGRAVRRPGEVRRARPRPVRLEPGLHQHARHGRGARPRALQARRHRGPPRLALARGADRRRGAVQEGRDLDPDRDLVHGARDRHRPRRARGPVRLAPRGGPARPARRPRRPPARGRLARHGPRDRVRRPARVGRDRPAGQGRRRRARPDPVRRGRRAREPGRGPPGRARRDRARPGPRDPRGDRDVSRRGRAPRRGRGRDGGAPPGPARGDADHHDLAGPAVPDGQPLDDPRRAEGPGLRSGQPAQRSGPSTSRSWSG